MQSLGCQGCRRSGCWGLGLFRAFQGFRVLGLRVYLGFRGLRAFKGL